MPYFPPVLLSSGASVGATVQAQVFTNGAVFNTAPSTTNSFLVGGRYNPIDTSGSHTTGSFQIFATPTASTSASYRALTFDAGTATGNANNLTAAFGLVAVTGAITHRGSGTITGACTLYVPNPNSSGGGSITTVCGLYMDSLTRGATNYAIYTNLGLVRFGDQVQMAAGTTAAASVRIPHGVAPTAPVNGDVWTTTAGIFVHINGATKTIVTVSSPATYTPSNVSTDRTYDANATTLDELADIVGTLIADLKLTGIIL